MAYTMICLFSLMMGYGSYGSDSLVYDRLGYSMLGRAKGILCGLLYLRAI